MRVAAHLIKKFLAFVEQVQWCARFEVLTVMVLLTKGYRAVK
jgi:hypothetical protein